MIKLNALRDHRSGSLQDASAEYLIDPDLVMCFREVLTSPILGPLEYISARAYKNMRPPAAESLFSSPMFGLTPLSFFLSFFQDHTV